MKKLATLLALALTCTPCLARPMYCTDPHPTGGLPSWATIVTLRVTSDERLQYRERQDWNEWDWKLLPTYLKDATEREPKPFVELAVHDADVPFDKIVPIIRQVQIAQLPQLWLEAKPLAGRFGDKSVMFDQHVICWINPNEDFSARTVITLSVAPHGAMFWNGEPLNRSQVMSRIKDESGPIIKISPSPDAKVSDVVQTMWEIAQRGSEVMALDTE